jgi:hypothetical protein
MLQMSKHRDAGRHASLCMLFILIHLIQLGRKHLSNDDSLGFRVLQNIYYFFQIDFIHNLASWIH